jgi:tRNA nucleotidyltransferase (CCA-adding enzyme)
MHEETFNDLKKLFLAQGHRLYIVGGTARDLLLGRPYDDLDFATDATPSEERAFLPDASYIFAQYGSVKVTQDQKPVDITTLRVEEDYRDFRHPGTVVFVKDPKRDYLRRDFTINALYLDEEYALLDYCGGWDDLQAKLLRFVGDPARRVREDPLRIIRAERFALSLGFTIEPKTQKAIDEARDLLKELNPAKIEEERRKGWKGKL